jgi:hypothetical protein
MTTERRLIETPHNGAINTECVTQERVALPFLLEWPKKSIARLVENGIQMARTAEIGKKRWPIETVYRARPIENQLCVIDFIIARAAYMIRTPRLSDTSEMGRRTFFSEEYYYPFQRLVLCLSDYATDSDS